MPVETVPTYIATVRSDRTITLPPDVPVGAQVSVTLVSDRTATEEAARRARFEATLAAIRAAMQVRLPRPPSDTELDVIIKKARKPRSG